MPILPDILYSFCYTITAVYEKPLWDNWLLTFPQSGFLVVKVPKVIRETVVTFVEIDFDEFVYVMHKRCNAPQHEEYTHEGNNYEYLHMSPYLM